LRAANSAVGASLTDWPPLSENATDLSRGYKKHVPAMYVFRQRVIETEMIGLDQLWAWLRGHATTDTDIR